MKHPVRQFPFYGRAAQFQGKPCLNVPGKRPGRQSGTSAFPARDARSRQGNGPACADCRMTPVSSDVDTPAYFSAFSNNTFKFLTS